MMDDESLKMFRAEADSLVEALEETDADLDFSDVEGYQEDHLVTTASADDRLAAAIDESS